MHVFYEALRLGAPSMIHASRTTMHGGLFRMLPDDSEILPPRIDTPESESYSSVIAWDFPVRGNLPPLRMHCTTEACGPSVRLNSTLARAGRARGFCLWATRERC